MPLRSMSRPKICRRTDSRLEIFCRTDRVCYSPMRVGADNGFVLVLILSESA